MTPQAREERLKEIEEREKNATAGPWRLDPDSDHENIFYLVDSNKKQIVDSPDDLKFIAMSREAVPFLLSEIARLEAENEHTANTAASIARVNVALQKETEALRARNVELERDTAELKEKLSFYSQHHKVLIEAFNEGRLTGKELINCLQSKLEAAEAAASHLKSALDKAVTALEWAMPYLEDLYGDFYSAKWLPGSGLNNRAGYKLLHDKAGLETAREALAEIKEPK